jgi:hypothetical protein
MSITFSLTCTTLSACGLDGRTTLVIRTTETPLSLACLVSRYSFDDLRTFLLTRQLLPGKLSSNPLSKPLTPLSSSFYIHDPKRAKSVIALAFKLLMDHPCLHDGAGHILGIYCMTVSHSYIQRTSAYILASFQDRYAPVTARAGSTSSTRPPTYTTYRRRYGWLCRRGPRERDGL